MHDSVMAYIRDTVARLDLNRPGLRAVDFGSLDVNGSTRDLFSACSSYVGVDVRPGRGVDIICDAAQYEPAQPVDVVVSTSTLEHAPNACDVVANALCILKPGGVFLGTCATDPWPVHGADGGDLRAGEHYRNVPPEDLAAWLIEAGAEDARVYPPSRDGDLCWYAFKDSDSDAYLYRRITGTRDVNIHAGAREARRSLKVDLGAGTARHREGYIRIDQNPATEPDIVAVMPPIPLPDESCELVYASHFIEHLSQPDVMALMAEVWRVLIPGGTAEMIVPYALSHGAFQDPTHRSYFVPESFLYYTDHYRYLKYDVETRFRVALLGIDETQTEVVARLVKLDE